MAYDHHLADRVRAVLDGRGTLREKAMFGGLAFMVDDRMAVCVSVGGGALLVRVPRDRDAEHLRRPGVRRAEMGAGRSMGEGWIAVDDEHVADDADLRFWIDAATGS